MKGKLFFVKISKNFENIKAKQVLSTFDYKFQNLLAYRLPLKLRFGHLSYLWGLG